MWIRRWIYHCALLSLLFESLYYFIMMSKFVIPLLLHSHRDYEDNSSMTHAKGETPLCHLQKADYIGYDLKPLLKPRIKLNTTRLKNVCLSLELN